MRVRHVEWEIALLRAAEKRKIGSTARRESVRKRSECAKIQCRQKFFDRRKIHRRNNRLFELKAVARIDIPNFFQRHTGDGQQIELVRRTPAIDQEALE
jgi:hypothetical protein